MQLERAKDVLEKAKGREATGPKGGAMEERILVPLDGSKIGEAALPYVEDLVSKMSPEVKVEVTLLQILAPITVVGGEAAGAIAYSEEQIEQTKKKAMEYLDKAGEGLRSRGAIVECKVGVGKAADEIIKAADGINADLIAMSTHGRSPIRRWALGSVTDKVLRGGHKPVLLVRTPKEPAQT